MDSGQGVGRRGKGHILNTFSPESVPAKQTNQTAKPSVTENALELLSKQTNCNAFRTFTNTHNNNLCHSTAVKLVHKNDGDQGRTKNL